MIVEPVVLVVIALSSYRLTGVLTGVDSLFEGTHRRILAWAYEVDHCGGAVLDECREMVRKPGVGLLRAKFVDMVTCPFCLGFHVCWAMLCTWAKVWPWELGYIGWMTALALAGVQSFLTSIDRR